VVGAAAALAAFAWFGSSEPAVPTDAREKIAIAPFRVSGADPALAYLHEGMVDLLAARFVDQTLTHAVDPGQSMSAWRRMGGPEANTDHENALHLAKRVGATGVVVGSVVGGPTRVYVTASMLSAASGKPEIEVRAEGPADSLTAVIDRLAGRLLAARYGETERIVRRTTASLPALRAYLTGQAAYRRAEYQAAARQFEAALRADSQFAVAAFYLALASDRTNDGEQHDRALAIAWQHSAELTVHDRAHLVAFAGPNYPRPSLSSDVLAAWGAALNLTPVRADMWYEFGERLLRQGSHFGITDAPQRALRAFARALSIDPEQSKARAMAIFAAANIGDTLTVRRHATPAAIRDSMGALSPFVRWTVARFFGDGNELARMRGEFENLDDENLRLIAMSSLRENSFVADGERAARMLGRRATNVGQLDALLAQHAFALNARDSSRALDLTTQLEDRMPGTGAHLRLRILDALYGNGNSQAARDAAARLDRATALGARGTETERAIFLANACVLSQWRLAQGERASIPASIESLRASGWTRVPAIGTNPHLCAVLLETWLAVESRGPNAYRQLVAADSLLLHGPAAGDAGRYAHILLARLHQRVGDNPGALYAIRRRSNLTGWPRYRANARSREATIRSVIVP
jgi:tetratricopeptide (TPR) repeat protein